MNGEFAQGLLISAIGIATVFAALALLWGLIALLARFPLPTELIKQAEAPTGPPQPAVDNSEMIPTAGEMAAIATALALLREEQAADAARAARLHTAGNRWTAIGRGRSLVDWQPPRDRHSVDASRQD